MSRNALETATGVSVLGVAFWGLFFAYSKSNFGLVEGYVLIVKLSGLGSVSKEANIRKRKIKVGNVVKSNINPETYLKKNNGRNKERHEASSQYNGSNLCRGPDGGRHVHLQIGARNISSLRVEK